MRNDVKPALRKAAGRVGQWRRPGMQAALAGAVLAVITLAARAGDAKAPADAGVAEVHIDNFAFTPAELSIAKGTTVKWINRDDIPHTVVEKGITFKSKTMDTDETFTHTFDTAGELTYFCSLHPHMTGKIIVK